MVDVPVLFETFARPEYARQAFDAIKQAKPRTLYFYSNKARSDRPDEVERNNVVREYIKEIDWDCDLHTFLRDEYVDVFTSLWGSLDWFFSNVDCGIVIEEDVVTCPAFYDYMTQLLNKYKDTKNVWLISGDNALPQYSPKRMSYFPSRFADIYGWGSWADRWNSMDREMAQWPSFRHSKEFTSYYGNWMQRFLQKKYFDQVYNNKENYHSWDIVLHYNMALNNGYCLMPFTNMVADIGVSGANHNSGQESPLGKIRIDTEYFPFEKGEPDEIIPTTFDAKFYYHNRVVGLLKRKIYKYLRIKL